MSETQLIRAPEEDGKKSREELFGSFPKELTPGAAETGNTASTPEK